MREIRFRGKRVDNGGWVYGNVIFKTSDAYSKRIDCGIQSDHCYPQEVDKETVGQFTGLTDKNGVEIYESDKVIIRSEDEEIGVVKWDETELMYVVEFDTYTLELGNFYGKEIEIVGNIHEVSE